jgi:site-specific DNA recombinase
MKAAIYRRVSTDRQSEEGFSLEAQYNILSEVAKKKGMEIYKDYSDPGISGKTIKKRPGIQQMIKDMKEGKFEAIIVHKLDRLSRNLGDLYEFIALVNKLNIRLVIAAFGSEEIDTSSPMGKAFLYFNGIFAEIYSDNLREETLKGLKMKISQGGRHMSVAPLGYDFDEDRNLLINTQEALLVRMVFDYYLAGKGVVWIAKQMNEHSRGKKGGVWDSKYIRILLTNKTYIGINHFKPKDSVQITNEGDHRPIIEESAFNRVQEMMERRKRGHMSKTSHAYPYGGIVRCHKCGATYIGYSSTQKLATGLKKTYKSYRCRNAYSNNTCDASAISEIKMNELIFNEIELTTNRINTDNKKNGMNIKQIERELEVAKKRKKNWMIALGDGKLNPDDYAELIEEEDKRIEHISKEYQKEMLYSQQLSDDEIRGMISNLKENWDYVDEDIQKQTIQSMIRKVTINKEKDEWIITELLTV